MHDYYRILGIARDASPQVVKYAFEGKAKALAEPAYAASPAEKRGEEPRYRLQSVRRKAKPAKHADAPQALTQCTAPFAAERFARPGTAAPPAASPMKAR